MFILADFLLWLVHKHTMEIKKQELIDSSTNQQTSYNIFFFILKPIYNYHLVIKLPIFMQRQICYTVHDSYHLDYFLSILNPADTATSYLFQVHFINAFRSTSRSFKCAFACSQPHHKPVWIFLSLNMCHISTSTSSNIPKIHKYKIFGEEFLVM
jgi:hypothetical protein